MARNVVALALISLLLLQGCVLTPDAEDGNRAGSFSAEEKLAEADRVKLETPTARPKNLFPNSFWYEKLNGQWDEKDEEARLTIKLAAEEAVALSVDAWTMPVYFADELTPRLDLPLLIDWTPLPNMSLRNVPIPERAREDPATNEGDPEAIRVLGEEEARLGDGSLVIIDTTEEPWVEIDIWQARMVLPNGTRAITGEERAKARWVASWANFIPLNSEGVFRCGLSGRGSGAAYLAGMIWPEELKEGIDHKIAMSFPYNMAGTVLEPFTETDGYLSEEEMKRVYEEITGEEANAYPIPEGAILQLDPNIDLDSWEVTDPKTGEKRRLKPYEKVIAKALQEYGAVNIDNSGSGIQLYAINSISYSKDPYLETVGERNEYGAIELPKELFTEAHLVKMRPANEIRWGLSREAWERYACEGRECNPPEERICE